MNTPLRDIDARLLIEPEQFRRNVVEPCLPAVMRGLITQWPAVAASARSVEDLADYLASFDNGGETEAFVGDPAISGNYYYGENLQGFNFERRRIRFVDALRVMVETRDRRDAPSMYVGSVPVGDYLPGFASQNALPVLAAFVAPRIWLGHPANVAAHFDTVDNVACVIAGQRRFTLYPPQAVRGLYVGPIDNTMAGQPVSLAASGLIDEDRYPLFRDVRSQALHAVLEPGDAIYIPKLWWHQVESLAPFNCMINYWWDAFAAGPDAPYTSLLLSMIAIAERPPQERQAWRAFFDHYVFRTNGHPLEHLPADQHGMLGPLKPDNYARIRAIVMHRLRGG